jgi:threonyl-tRNA synthetase
MSEHHIIDKLEPIRHSASHVMAQAVLEKFPEGKLAIGPAIEDGFYYDFDLPRPLTPQDLEQIEARMKEIIKGKYEFAYREISREDALELFKDQPYKLELIADLPEDEAISVYTHDTFTDLCRGPHVENTAQIKANALKLMSVAGAYWRGDERRPMLQRIYGTVWNNKAELDAHLKRLAELEARDHRRLIKQLDLVSFHEEVGAGLALWHPKGGRIRVLIEDYWRKLHYEGGYDIVFTPHIGRANLWETSGHLDFYKDSMYSPMDIEGQEYYIKPMNCPFQIMIYKSQTRSYRDLPLRWAELGTVYRYERSGTLHGLMRVRGFTQDDAHIICTPEQIDDEILRVLDFSVNLLSGFGFDEFRFDLSVRDPENLSKYAGEDDMWQQAEASLAKALETRNLPYKRMEGEAVFYGPKIDIHIKDALGRTWQCTTIQFDFNLPGRFDMAYVGEDGQEHRPYVVHRALLGAIERFFGILVEHCAGAFPVWLMPVQAIVIPIADRHNAYAERVLARLTEAGIRAKADLSTDRMNAKIRNAQMDKIPYMLVIGDRELEADQVNLRQRDGQQPGAMNVDDFVALVQRAVAERRVL